MEKILTAEQIQSLRILIRLLWRSAYDNPQDLIAFGRALSYSLGVQPNPVGCGNAKTRTPSTYRPVGVTCPRSCHAWEECYARGGNVGLHQARADAGVLPSVFSSAIAVVAALRDGTLARLHVSGDFYSAFKIDDPYLECLQGMCAILRGETGEQGPFAWTYTAAPTAQALGIRDALESSGILVLLSGHHEGGGAVIYPHDRLADLVTKNPGVKYVPCPAQMSGTKTSCKKCKLCFRARELDICVVFTPEGIKKKALISKLLSE